MKTYLFLLSWIENSDSASGEKTLVHSQDDLVKQFWDENEHIFAVVLKVPSGVEEKETASKWGYAEAFFNNYTAYDSVSLCNEIPNNTEFPFEIKTVHIHP
jgi:hypothetical protein